MYGTVARFKLLPGKEEELLELTGGFAELNVPGWVSSAAYRADAGGDEYWLTVVFENKEAYRANAESPEQDARFQRIRALMAADPEWHDGEVIANSAAG
jgi:antibiotic biosynthesis monooxygenase (ABM) superfamily enzyme